MNDQERSALVQNRTLYTSSNTILVYSGGLDSTVLLYFLKYRYGLNVRALTVDYGQRHRREIESAKRICAVLNMEHKVADLRPITQFMGGSSQTDGSVPVPDGHYTAETMKATVVPNRNMLLLSVATAWAISTRSPRIAYAAHAGDHAIYPDCRPEFVDAMQRTMVLADEFQVMLFAPFIRNTKAEIVKLGQSLGVPMHWTWSCYKGQERHCGKCGTCVERREAFALSGVDDLTDYEGEAALPCLQ